MRTILVAALLATILSACGSDIDEYEISSTTIDQFVAGAEKMATRDDANAPLAMSVLDTNTIGVPPGIQVWNPDETLKSVGINNADLIALINDQVPSQEYRSAFSPGQEPFESATEQYVHFVSGLYGLRASQAAVDLAIYPQYNTMAERKKYGRLHTKDPKYIRIVFE